MGQFLQPTIERDFTFATDKPFRLELGGELQPITLRYAIYGELKPGVDITLVCHALTASARAAEWWPDMFTADGLFDPQRDCVICINVLGSCYGSTGPVSINPQTGSPFQCDFPLVTIKDIVRSQAALLDHLGIERIQNVIGGSIGGMQAIQWAVDYPERVETCINIGSSQLPAMGLALNHLQRTAIVNDPAWCGGRYSDENSPKAGIALARGIGMCTYKSAEQFDERFARRPNRNGEDPCRSMNERFDVAGYLDHQGEKFHSRFDANTYLVLSKVMDTFDPARGYASEHEALQRIQAHILMIGISSDWLFPPQDVRGLADRMIKAGADAQYIEFQTMDGHDAFLSDPLRLASLVRETLTESA